MTDSPPPGGPILDYQAPPPPEPIGRSLLRRVLLFVLIIAGWLVALWALGHLFHYFGLL